MRQLEWKSAPPRRRRRLRTALASGIAAEWPRLLTLLFSGLFLIAFIHWFSEEDGGFLPKTTLLLYCTLAIVFVTEAAAFKNKLLVRLLQFLILLGFHAIALDYTPVWAHPENARQLWRLLLVNAEQLFPYFWFSLGGWMIYLATVWWMNNKKRIVAALLVGVLAMALRDSFSLVYLWDEAAWLILCGLFLLVVRQFGNLRDKSPEGWGYIADYPVSFVAPIVLLLTLTVGAGTLAPDVANVLTDPYTLYKRWEGEPVALSGKIKEITGPILSGTGKTVSGYSRDDSSLGGGFDYDYASVFKVETTRRSYWRGETKSVYTGKGWTNPKGADSGLVEVSGVGRGMPRPINGLDASKRKTVSIKQTVTLLEKSPKYPVLFGAFEVHSIEEVNGKPELAKALWNPASSVLQWGESYPKSYTLTSEMPILDEAAFRKAPADYPEKAELEPYLSLPDVPERVLDLAREITRDAANPYDKAKALEQYLKSTYPYTNTPADGNTSKDFVDRFLFETKEGYCDYYSTAMAVMGRAVGLPTRWVKGYSSGSNPEDEMQGPDVASRYRERDPNGAGTYTVHNSNAHSWVEVYFSGYGWIPFDPTAGFSVPYAADPTKPAEAPVVDQTPDDSAKPDAAKGDGSSQAPLWIALAAAVVLVAAAAFWYLAGYRRGRWVPPGIASRRAARRAETNYNRQIVKEFEKLLRYFRRRGFPVLEHETARETLGRWREKDAWLTQDLDKLIALFEKAKYSPVPVTELEAARAAGIVHKLRKEI
ncbi:DUF4129 domain-containing transglutaminase family protein [Gorillibacterium sp. sgz500922]|uniref:DUF4129 domain-containing transglutaminase family protein n=1 Tax=Gorillibacterium sp. sgz500922 TaxID=3446694 RepID=UPI003F66AAB5